MIQVIKQWMTAKDNVTWSLTKLIGMGGSAAMIGEFLYKGSVDYQGFGIGLTTIMGALAAKYFAESNGEKS